MGLCALHILIQKSYRFSLIADEVTDVSNRKQVVVCTRWVDKQLNIKVDEVELIYDFLIRTVNH